MGGSIGTQRNRVGEENCDSSEAVIDAASVYLHCTVPAKRRAPLICSRISKKVGSQPEIFLCTCTNYQALAK